MIVVHATPADLPLLLAYRREAAGWLAEIGINQWSNPFPEEHILASIEGGNVYLVVDDKGPMATVTLDNEPEPDLWTKEELDTPSFHLHKLIVSRRSSGLGIGTKILDWASNKAATDGKEWLRINAWTTNTKLHRYWESHGFMHVRTVTGGGVGNAGVAGWLAQRPARRCRSGLHDHTSADQLR
ncbi:GNAT family N-acetyltransferase [Streptomyces zhaozhouensis]|uniref:GNAT family N-acetyltransferase n=1 Tax=Streptomyces zhaozhouensis TaxID=1300267 RepID=UPI000BE44EC5|nr:GNAT family N-acetyltransferase [Streptomyces zhaozhouensis]